MFPLLTLPTSPPGCQDAPLSEPLGAKPRHYKKIANREFHKGFMTPRILEL